MMTGTKKPPEGGFLRDTKAGQGKRISNESETQNTTNNSGCNSKSAYTGSAAVGYNQQQLLLACIDRNGGTATQLQVIAAFKHAGFRPQQARNAIETASLLRDVQVFHNGLDILVQRQVNPDAVESRKRLVPVEVQP